MEFLIAGLLVLDLAVTLVSGYLLGRDSRRKFAALQKELAKTNDAMSIGNNIFRELEHVISEAESRRKADAESMKRTLLDLAHGVEVLPDLMKALQKDSAQTFARLEALLENAPDVLGQEDEARLSGSMEEGISNLLQYQVGKRREQS